jgi:hypothetical protein
LISGFGVFLQNLGEGVSKEIIHAIDKRLSLQDEILRDLGNEVRALEYPSDGTSTDNLRRVPKLPERPLLGLDMRPKEPDSGKPEISEPEGSM